MRKAPAVFPLLLLVSALACADVRVRIIETDPPSPATLHHWEEFSVRIAYETDRPIRVWGEAYLAGNRVPSMTSGSPRYEPGTGEALFWFAFTTPARVDTIVVRAEDEKARVTAAQDDLSVNVTWTGQKPVARREKAAWVARLQADRDHRHREEAQAYANRPRPWWEPVLFMAAAWSIPLYFIVEIVVLWRWRGGWRIAAAVPAVPMLLVLGHAIFAFFAGSNIFPLFLFFTCLPALIYLVFLTVLRRLRRQPEHV